MSNSSNINLGGISLVFVRHGETEFNVEKRYMGHLDSPLSKKGIAQVAAVPFAAVKEFIRKLELRLPLIVFNGAGIVCFNVPANVCFCYKERELWAHSKAVQKGARWSRS